MGKMMTEMRGLHVPLNPEELYVLSLDCSPFINSLKCFLFFRSVKSKTPLLLSIQ